MDQKLIEDYLLSMPNTQVDYPFGKSVAAYKQTDKLFALLTQDKQPLQLSLKGDPQLNKLLRRKYETVLPGHNLNQNQWNTIILSGQLPWEELQGLIRHSYQLVSAD
ncbi:MAG: MmcQ/YjbR family DNA-binding protein [Candidatus Saccharimonadales bacterium]